MNWTTPDLCDRFPDLSVAAPALRHYGGRSAFHGPIATVRCHEDNSRVREQVLGPGHGRVLVVDGGGSLRCALLGDLLAAHALENGWAGVVVHGAVRDVEVLATLPLGVMALAACPRRSDRRGLGEVGGRLAFAEAVFEPGHWLYADANGIVLAPAALPLEPVV